MYENMRVVSDGREGGVKRRKKRRGGGEGREGNGYVYRGGNVCVERATSRRK